MKIISTATVLSLMVTALTSCNTFIPRPTETPTLTKTILPKSTNTAEPTLTPTEMLIPQHTKTGFPATFVDTQNGMQLINNQYGFTITLPSDSDVLFFNPTDDQLLSVQLPTKDLSDGGQILTWFRVWVENHTTSCHPELTNSSNRPVKVGRVTLGNTHFIKVYTPDLDKDELQAIEYMSYGTDFCVHFFTGLAMYYFDRGDAEPGNMLPHVQDELGSIISTFEWVN